MKSHLTWQAPEYNHSPKTRDWYTAVVIITITMTVLAIIFGNYIFALFIVLSAFTLSLHSFKPPETIGLEITNKGIVVKKTLYPYSTLESFWVDTDNGPAKILIKSKKMLMPYITLPIHEEDADDARSVLLAYLKEEEHSEPLSQKIMEYLGF